MKMFIKKNENRKKQIRCRDCDYFWPVYWHCSTQVSTKKTGKKHCVCNVQKGWACCLGKQVYDNWKPQFNGCECFTPKVKSKL